MVDAKQYTWGTGRRKKAIARVRIAPGSGQMIVNRREVSEYFPTPATIIAAKQPLRVTETESEYDIHVNVNGGGAQGQADAVRHGLARALVSANPALEASLRGAGFLTRDARVKERKKYGQRGARARFQFSKR